MIPDADIKNATKSKSSNDKLSVISGPVILITAVLFSYVSGSFKHANLIPLFILLPLILVQQILLFLPSTKNKDFFSSGGPAPLIIYNLATFVMYVFYIPLYSPFLFSLAITIFITVYFRGQLVLLFSLINSLLIVIFSYLRNGLPNENHATLYPYILLVMVLCYTVLVQRAGAIDNKIRQQLIKAGQKIDEEKGQLNSLINGISDSVVATDENGNIIFFNTSTLKMFGFQTIQIGEPFSKTIRLYDDKTNLIDFFSLVSLDKEQKSVRNVHLVDQDNEIVNLSVDISKVNSIYNKTEKQGVIFLIRDVTKEKSLDEERDEFAAVTSHELRTPIAIAEANLSLAMDKRFIQNLDSASMSRLEQAHQSIIYLADLINQLAELSNIETEGVKVNYEQVDPGNILRQFQKDFKNNADEKGLTLNVEITDNLHPLQTSKVYLTEILENFLTNAIKYTSKGSITLKAENSTGLDGAILFSVTDTGDGIGNLDKNRIFHKFYRAEDYRTKKTRGTGLGLYLTLKIAKFINGKIWFTSELNQGSIFYLEVPPLNPELNKTETNTKTQNTN